MTPSPAHGRGRQAPGSGVVQGAASEDSRPRRRAEEPTRIRPPGEPSQAPVGAPPEYTREPSTTGIGPWREHDFTGRVFSGRFQLRRRLGKGGMATVYETFDQVLHKSVAVKVLNPEHSESAELNRRFLEEARAISQLAHDHIVDVIDIGETEDGLVYLVMELLKGEDLGETLWQDGRLAWWRVLDIGAQICEALAAAHERGIIHRDIKPANCMRIAYRGKSDFIKVLDFGIAKFTPSYYHHKRQLGAPEESNAELPTDQFLGTPGYMAPEQLDNAPFDPRVDIYGLGALMYRLLTNKMPVPTGARASGAAHDHTPVPPSAAVSGVEIPEPLERAVLQALAPDPDARFQSALQFRDALTQLQRELRPPSRLTGDPLSWGTDAPVLASRGADARSPAWTIVLVLLALLAGVLLARFALTPVAPPLERLTPPPRVTPNLPTPPQTPAAAAAAAAAGTSDDPGDLGAGGEARATDSTGADPLAEPELKPSSEESGEPPSPEQDVVDDEAVTIPATTPDAELDDSATTDAGGADEATAEAPTSDASEESAETQPEDEPAKQSIPRKVPRRQFVRKIARARGSVRACYQRHTGGFGADKTLEVVFTIDGQSGRILKTAVPARGALTAVDQCIKRSIDKLGLTFSHARQNTTHRYTFEL